MLYPVSFSFIIYVRRKEKKILKNLSIYIWCLLLRMATAEVFPFTCLYIPSL